MIQFVSLEEPKGVPIVRVTELLKLRLSPRHFQAHVNGEIDEAESKAMRLGTMLHMALLEPFKFSETYTKTPTFETPFPETIEEIKEWLSLRGTQAPTKLKKGDLIELAISVDPTFKTQTQAIADRVSGKTVLSDGDWDIITKTRDEAMRHPLIRAMLEGKNGELVCERRLWGEAEGVTISGQPDLIAGNMVIDIKRTFQSSPEAFMSSAFKYGYHVQAALYLELVNTLTGREHGFAWWTFESQAPYCAGFLVPDEAVLEAGRMEARRLLRLYKDCKKSDSWPGPAGFSPKMMSLKEWQLRETWELSAHINDEEGIL